MLQRRVARVLGNPRLQAASTVCTQKDRMGGTQVMSLASKARHYPCCHESTLPVATATIPSAKHAVMHKRTRGNDGREWCVGRP
jgi:hypothetical protein